MMFKLWEHTRVILWKLDAKLEQDSYDGFREFKLFGSTRESVRVWELEVKLELEFEHTYILINISAD